MFRSWVNYRSSLYYQCAGLCLTLVRQICPGASPRRKTLPPQRTGWRCPTDARLDDRQADAGAWSRTSGDFQRSFISVSCGVNHGRGRIARERSPSQVSRTDTPAELLRASGVYEERTPRKISRPVSVVKRLVLAAEGSPNRLGKSYRRSQTWLSISRLRNMRT